VKNRSFAIASSVTDWRGAVNALGLLGLAAALAAKLLGYDVDVGGQQANMFGQLGVWLLTSWLLGNVLVFVPGLRERLGVEVLAGQARRTQSGASQVVPRQPPEAPQRQSVQDRARDLLRQHMEYVVRTGEGISNVDSLQDWRNLFRALKQHRTAYPVDVAELLRDEELLRTFMNLYFETFKQASGVTGNPYIDAVDNHRKMLELLQPVALHGPMAGARPDTQQPQAARPQAEVARWKAFFGEGSYNDFLINSFNGKRDAALESRMIREAEAVDPKLGQAIRRLAQEVTRALQAQAPPQGMKDIDRELNALLEPLGLYAYYVPAQRGQSPNRVGFLIFEIASRRSYQVTEKATGTSFARSVRFLKQVSQISAMPAALGVHVKAHGGAIENVFLDSIASQEAGRLTYLLSPDMTLSTWKFGLSESLTSGVIETMLRRFPHRLQPDEAQLLRGLLTDLELVRSNIERFYQQHPDFPLELAVLPTSRAHLQSLTPLIQQLDEKDRARFEELIKRDVEPLVSRLEARRSSYEAAVRRVKGEIDRALDRVARETFLAELGDHVSQADAERARRYVRSETGRTRLSELLTELGDSLRGTLEGHACNT
jgi:hypothetical protein